MLACIYSVILLGLEPIKVEVEVDSRRGVPALVMIGLASKAVVEAKERVTAALMGCGIRMKAKRTIVNLAPADLQKNDSHLELAVAVALLQHYRFIKFNTRRSIFFGELSLNGQLKAIKGALALVLAAKEMGFEQVFLPKANVREVVLVDGIKVMAISHLKELIDIVDGDLNFLPKVKKSNMPTQIAATTVDLADIFGQAAAKRALTIAAAGNHNLLLIGPPGVGKTILAKAICGILPPLSRTEILAVTRIYSLLGLNKHHLISQRPFRNPHHNISATALIGGGSVLKPGEISLAHHGVLFLDEFPEFSRSCIEALRQPLEEGVVRIARAAGSVSYPAKFALIAATNPCPCGYYQTKVKPCQCTPYARGSYRKKLSGPILDRIDMHVWVRKLEASELSEVWQKKSSKILSKKSLLRNQTSAQVRQQVIAARKIQKQRFHQDQYTYNADLAGKDVLHFCQLTSEAQKFLNAANKNLQLSVRAYYKIIKIARTIADLEGEFLVKKKAVAEALSYRAVF